MNYTATEYVPLPLYADYHAYAGVARPTWATRLHRAWNSGETACVRAGWLAGQHLAWRVQQAETAASDQSLLIECRLDHERLMLQEGFRTLGAFIQAAFHILGNRNHF